VIDLHCHLLPGIDDGPDTLDESLGLARLAVADGTSRMVVTPHMHPGRWDNARDTIAVQCAALQSALDEQNIPLRLGYAAEVRLGDHIMSDLEQSRIPYYGEMDGYQIMLLEFPHGHLVPGSEALCRWLLENGVRPLIAHPERNRELMRAPDRLLPFVAAGCLLQVTAGSLLGAFGRQAESVSHRLLEQDVVSVVASDGHNATARQPVLSAAYHCVEQRYNETLARRLFIDNPERIAGSQFGSGVCA
jgi:protein-tyrosine phosphatase